MRFLAAVIVLLATPFIGLAQTSEVGKLQGIVTDAADSPIPKVQIVFENDSLRREVVSDEDGNYDLQLPFGTYRVTAAKQGYRPPKPQTVRVKSKGITRWDIQFPPINIINDPPIREPVSSGNVAQQIVGREPRKRVSHEAFVNQSGR
jgi:hypothetical protein